MTIALGSIINGRYELLSKIGEGGFATVFLARDHDLGRDAAVKILRPDAFDEEDRVRFKREARLLGKLVHANIVSAYAFDFLSGSLDGQGEDEAQSPFIVMEYLEGESLAKILARDGKLDFEQFCEIFLQVAEGLDYAHKEGVIHRDLSPANIFLLDRHNDLKVKLIDFGISKVLAESSATTKLTKTGFLIGTPSYMSPELAAGLPANALSDIYSLGCIMYESLTGKLPLEADNPIGVLYRQRCDYPLEPQLNWEDQKQAAAIKTLILQCIQKKPEMRFQSCRELHSALLSVYKTPILSGVKPPNAKLDQWAGSSGEKSVTNRGIPIQMLLLLTSTVAIGILAFSYRSATIEWYSNALMSAPSNYFIGAEQNQFDYLNQIKRPKTAAKLAENIAWRYSKSKDGLKESEWLLKAAAANIANTNRQQAWKNICKAFALCPSDSAHPKSKEFLSNASRLIDLATLTDPPTLEEIELRSNLILQMSNQSFRNGLAKAYDNFLERATLFYTRQRMPLVSIEAFVVPLERKQIVLSARDDEHLDDLSECAPFLARFVDANFSYARLAKARLNNTGTPEWRKVDLELMLLQRSHLQNPAAEEKMLKEFLRKDRDLLDSRQIAVYLRLAKLSQKLGDQKQAAYYVDKAFELRRMLAPALVAVLLDCLFQIGDTSRANSYCKELVSSVESEIGRQSGAQTTESYVYGRYAKHNGANFGELQNALTEMAKVCDNHKKTDMVNYLMQNLDRILTKYRLRKSSQEALLFRGNVYLDDFSHKISRLLQDDKIDEAFACIKNSKGGPRPIDSDSLYLIANHCALGLREKGKVAEALDLLRCVEQTVGKNQPIQALVSLAHDCIFLELSEAQIPRVTTDELRQLSQSLLATVQENSNRLTKKWTLELSVASLRVVRCLVAKGEVQTAEQSESKIFSLIKEKELSSDVNTTLHLEAVSFIALHSGKSTSSTAFLKNTCKEFFDTVNDTTFKIDQLNLPSLSNTVANLSTACTMQDLKTEQLQIAPSFRNLVNRLGLMTPTWKFVIRQTEANNMSNAGNVKQVEECANGYLKDLKDYLTNGQTNRDFDMGPSPMFLWRRLQDLNAAPAAKQFLLQVKDILSTAQLFDTKNKLNWNFYFLQLIQKDSGKIDENSAEFKELKTISENEDLDPNTRGEAFFALGSLLNRAAKLDEAINNLQSAINCFDKATTEARLERTYMTYLTLRGIYDFKIKDEGKARNALHRACLTLKRLNPSDPRFAQVFGNQLSEHYKSWHMSKLAAAASASKNLDDLIKLSSSDSSI